MWEKLKSFLTNDAYFTAVLIILIGVGSYNLGRLSVLETQNQSNNEIALKEITPLNNYRHPETESKTPVVVSKSGSKYHLFDCPGALQMKSENRIEFEKMKSPKAARHSPAAKFPGLKTKKHAYHI